MSTYRLVKRPQSSVVTMEFDYYNEAIAFMRASQALSPTKPWKRGLKWCVSYPRSPEKAVYVKVADWKPPLGYNEWRGLEALYHLQIPAPLPKAKAQHQEEEFA